MNYTYFHHPFRSGRTILVMAIMVMVQTSYSQIQEVSFQDLSAFKNPGKSWRVAGNVYADLEKSNSLEISKGSGILVNDPGKRVGEDLYTKEQFGNIDLEVDYMMAKGSNSGIYFLGQYELQLKDSWGFNAVTAAENGGINQRWEDQRSEGEQGYQGYAPRQNVSKAPGLWQHLEVSFQAPQFDANGEKTEHAKFIYVRLNGVTIHEDLELLGPTRGSTGSEEKASGSLRIQGDDGAVAFRNLKITKFDKPRPELSDIRYKIYNESFDSKADYSNLPPEAEGQSVVLTSDLGATSDQFVIQYSGDLQVEEAGEYTFNLNTAGGSGLIRINQNEVMPLSNGNGNATVNLSAGKQSFELLYTKVQDWVEPGLGLSVSGEGIREYFISDGEGNFEDPVDPILVEANASTVFRSFMSIPQEGESRGHLLTHAVSVGHPAKLHYTYDLNRGTIAQVWRGGFLDATPMWYQRGNGSSRPVGSAVHFEVPALTAEKLATSQQQWAADTTGRNFRSHGYKLDQKDIPTFMYSIYGSNIEDVSEVLDNAQGIQRRISVDSPVEKLHVRLASGKKIEKMSEQLYVVGDKEYYIRLDNIGSIKPVLRGEKEQQELLVPLREELTYTLLF